MTEEILLREIDVNGVGWLTLNRPDVHNAFNEDLIKALNSELRAYGSNPLVRAVAITGNGRSFCAGGDLNWMRRMAAASIAENIKDAEQLAAMLRTLDQLPKPTVAVIHGATMGGGTGLTAACDIAIAADSAVFGIPEVKIGLVPAVVSPYVTRAIGARQARRYFLTGERFSAEVAEKLGLVHMVVPAADLRSQAESILNELVANGAEAMASGKELIRIVADHDVDSKLLRETAERIARARASKDAQSRIAAFLERKSKKVQADQS